MPKKPATRPRGRPAYVPTAATRRQVSVAAGGGMRHEDIALALGISRETLSKHFEHELSIGAAMRRLEVLQAMHAAAKKGSTPAARVYLANEAKTAPPPPLEPGVDVTTPTKTPLVGKKEQAQIDAIGAAKGTDWDQLLTPRAPLQ